MAAEDRHPPPSSVDSRSGSDSRTQIFHGLRPSVPLPPLHLHLSCVDYALSILGGASPDAPLPPKPAFLDSGIGLRLSFSEFLDQVRNLASSIHASPSLSLSKGFVAFILARTSVQIPVLCFSLLSFGIVISPANPLSTPAETSRQLKISRPKIAFATSATASMLPPHHPVILLDSPEYRSMTLGTVDVKHKRPYENVGPPKSTLN